MTDKSAITAAPVPDTAIHDQLFEVIDRVRYGPRAVALVSSDEIIDAIWPLIQQYAKRETAAELRSIVIGVTAEADPDDHPDMATGVNLWWMSRRADDLADGAA